MTLALQDEPVTVAEACRLFHEVVLQFPATKTRHSTNAGIIENKTFDFVIIKVHSRCESDLSSLEIPIVNDLVKSEVSFRDFKSFSEKPTFLEGKALN